jgi:ribose-phosphate pyrophosphokinase
MEDLKVFMGNSNKPLGEAICRHLGIRPGDVFIGKFSNDNIFVQLKESVREKDVFIIQSLYPNPSEGVLELLLLCDAARSASARRITAVIPHYSYARSDKKDKPRISIAARLIADVLVTSGAQRFVTMNLHSDQVRGFFSVPTDHLLSEPVICEYLARLDLSRTTALLDLGQEKRQGNFAKKLGMPLAIINKERISDTEVCIKHFIGDVKGRDVILFEDEISRGTSLLAVVRRVKEEGAREVRIACTHGLFCGPALDYIRDEAVREVITTDTVDFPPERRIPKITVLSVAPLFAEVITRIHRGQSVSSLFE